MCAMPESWVYIGSVRSVNPARREVRVKPARRQGHQFESMTWLYVRPRDGDVIRSRVASIRPHADGLIIALVAGVTRDAVRRMKGGSAVVADTDQRPRPDDDWDVSDWIGVQVKGEDGSLLGVVRDVIPTRANDVITVERPDGTAFLLPVIEQVIAGVDSDQGALVVRDIAPYAVEANED
jgi:16S rRNA processing protein RimM